MWFVVFSWNFNQQMLRQVCVKCCSPTLLTTNNDEIGGALMRRRQRSVVVVEWLDESQRRSPY